MLKKAYGFTIVELLVVIVVIAIIAAVSVVAYSGIQKRAIETTLQSDLRSAATQLSLDKARNEAYPTALSLADDGKGIVGSNGTDFQYTSDGLSYCLTATSSRATTETYSISSTDSISVGSCNGHLTSEALAAIKPPTDCPEGFIPVPGNTTFGTNGFCVMKYEAKNVSGKAVSQAALRPWGDTGGSVTQTTASTYSQTACEGCHLVTEAEWMTIAANVLSVGSNWSGGGVGSGYLYTGHVTGPPSVGEAASTDDTDGLYGMTGGLGDGPQYNTRRTFTLTNGEVIWDFAGNMWEWTSGTMTPTYPGPNNYGAVQREYNAVPNWNNFPENSRPSVAGVLSTWTSANGIGKMYVGNWSHTAAFRRGGGWNSSNRGLFALELGGTTTSTATAAGFRAAR